MGKRTRRIAPADFGVGTTTIKRIQPGSFTQTEVHKNGTFWGTQVTESENHPGWYSNRSKGDVGGDFFTQKKWIEILNEGLVSTSVKNFDVGSGIIESYFYDGPVSPIIPGDSDYGAGFPDPLSASNFKLDMLGATAISRVAPTNTILNLVTFLGEILREGIPHHKFKLWENKVRDVKNLAKGSGDDYLNLKFGWEPLVRDITSSVQQIRHAEKVISQYERDAGKMVRRRYQFPDERNVSYGNFSDPARPYYAPRQTRLEKPGISHITDYIVETHIRRWFSGAFTYYLPSDWISRKKMRNARDQLSNIFELDLTPEAVWNLTPWSWAVDWFANTGDVLHNVSAFAGDALVLRYGYVMQHTLTSTTFISRDRSIFKDGAGSAGAVKFVVETKQRRHATPYGFGVSFDGLSAVQKAILAALGLSKGLK